MADIDVVFDDPAIALLPHDAGVRGVVDLIAAEAVSTMKFLCPVSPIGPKHRSGNLRSSIHSFREADGNVIVGPTADYAKYVNDDTVPHLIVSHGNYPLRDEWGHVFGKVVHHPGTHGQHFVEHTADTFRNRTYHV